MKIVLSFAYAEDPPRFFLCKRRSQTKKKKTLNNPPDRSDVLTTGISGSWSFLKVVEGLKDSGRNCGVCCTVIVSVSTAAAIGRAYPPMQLLLLSLSLSLQKLPVFTKHDFTHSFVWFIQKKIAEKKTIYSPPSPLSSLVTSFRG